MSVAELLIAIGLFIDDDWARSIGSLWKLSYVGENRGSINALFFHPNFYGAKFKMVTNKFFSVGPNFFRLRP